MKIIVPLMSIYWVAEHVLTKHMMSKALVKHKHGRQPGGLWRLLCKF